MTRWSGLGPAYDAHMRLWSQSQGAVDELNRWRLLVHPDEQRVFVAPPPAHSWIVFARTWGLPQADGTVRPGFADVGLADGQGGGPVPSDEATIQGREQYRDDDDVVERGVFLLSLEATTLGRATTHYVSGNIVDQVTLAAEQAEPEPLFATDLQTSFGFAVLERPLLLPDLDPSTGLPHPTLVVPIRAFSWAGVSAIQHGPESDREVGPGVMVTLYSTPDDHRAYYERAFQAAFHQASGIDFAGMRGDQFFATDVLPWAFGTNWSARETPVHQALTVPPTVAYWRRWYFTLMRFMWQTLLVPSDEPLPRPVRRRWAEEVKRRSLNDYTVLRLRRVINPERADEPTGTGTPLTHRVLVRGHWRRQHHPSLGPAYDPDTGAWNRDSHRLTWIEEHWRGPDDAPIGAMHHATVVAR